jgi:transcriptional regulator with XRE-family HTH domain
MNYGKIFAQNVKRIRLAKGYSQDELGEQSGLTRNYIGNIERRENSPSLQSMEAVADALGVSLLELLGQSDQK